MFRFASGYASEKFRSLSAYRLASPQPVAAVRHDAIAQALKCPSVKITEKVVRPLKLTGHSPVLSGQSPAITCPERSGQGDQQPEGRDVGCDIAQPTKGRNNLSSTDETFPRSLTVPQEDRDPEPPGKMKEAGEGSAGETTPLPDNKTAQPLPDLLNMTPCEMLKMSRSEKTAVANGVTDHIQRAVRANISLTQEEQGPHVEENKQNAEKAQQLFDQMQTPITAGPGSSQRNNPVNQTEMIHKPCLSTRGNKQPQTSPTQLGSLGTLPRIDKADLTPVMSRKGHSYSTVKLGSGSFGEVSLMQNCTDGTLIAVKRLTKVGNRLKAEEAFKRETQAMNAVSSSSAFPKFLGIVDRYSFAMEFLGDLDKQNACSAYKMFRKRSSKMKSLDWLKVATDVTQGLQDMHAAGWTHNDLHSDNVMVWRDPEDQSGGWEGKIIDLGYAYRIDNPPPPQQLTPTQEKKCFKDCGQLAPEVIKGTSRYNVKSDVYSLGQFFLDIVSETGRASCLKALGKRCINKDPNLRPTLDAVLQELALMHYERLNRPQKTGPLAGLFRSLKNRFRG
ncbi:uncharacterized protein LOC110990686 [Acanthaster planci]|uniref:Uncharacterized protein LOC110990686 n=1 Tax=Acanthaster planci TaxID=133434 RepID=A0A8B8A1F1_ACAPL|nr:uncharacterized protein LOC110990686 [Acanthaster planci]